MRKVFLLIAILIILIPIKAQSQFESDTDKYVWDLSSLYSNDESWENERQNIQEKIATINEIKELFGRDANSLFSALETVADLRSRAGKMAVYGSLLTVTEPRGEKTQAKFETGLALETQVESAVSFVDNEVRKIGEQKLKEYFRAEPKLERFRNKINRILRETPHTLNSEAQAVIKSMRRWQQTSDDSFWALIESDLGWRKVKNAEGKEVKANQANYTQLRTLSDSNLRETAIKNYLERLKVFENAFGLFLTRRIEAESTIAKHRKFKDGIQAFLFQEGFPSQTPQVMIQTARQNLSTLRRYIGLRARALGLNRQSHFDFYASSPSINRRFTVADSMEIIVAVSSILGKEYQEKMRKSLQLPIWDLANTSEKRDIYGGTYSVGGAYPYAHFKFRGTFTDSANLSGLAFPKVAWMNIGPKYSSETRFEPPLFGNFLVYAGRILHNDYVMAQAKDKQEKIAFLLRSLDDLRNSFFRTIMISEFELQVQEIISNGERPNGAKLSQLYLKLMREYFGHETNSVVVDEVFSSDWINNRVSFYSFETFGFPLSYAAATILVERLRLGDQRAKNAFDRGLGYSESDFSFDLMRDSGVDMSNSEPYLAVIKRMNFLMDELEKELKEIN